MRLCSGIQEFEPHDIRYTRTVSKYFQNKMKYEDDIRKNRTVSKYFQNKMKYEDDFEIKDNLSP